MLIPLDQPMLVELSGSEAEKILHNLTTNQVQNLAIGTAVESFVTDVRGWVVAHGLVLRVEPQRWWILGQHPDPARVAAHFDRYIIREDAKVCDRSAATCLLVFWQELSEPQAAALPEGSRSLALDTLDLKAKLVVLDSSVWNGVGLASPSAQVWESFRIPRAWPRMGLDILDKCIPQELDRTAQAICFTKGCYLGQETIARLDALGQIQKKLTLLRFENSPTAGVGVAIEAPVFSGDKQVGSVTSSALVGEECMALAVIRRGFFDVGTILTCDGLPVVVQKPLMHYA